MASPMHDDERSDEEDVLAELLGRDDDAYVMSDDEELFRAAGGDSSTTAGVASVGVTSVPSDVVAQEKIEEAVDDGIGLLSGLQASSAEPRLGDGRRSLANYSDIVELSNAAPTQPVTQISARGHRPQRDLDACTPVGTETSSCAVPFGFMGANALFQARGNPFNQQDGEPLEEGEVPSVFVMGSYTKEPHGRHHSAKAGARHKLTSAQHRRAGGESGLNYSFQAEYLVACHGGTSQQAAQTRKQKNKDTKSGAGGGGGQGGRQLVRNAAAETARYVRQTCEMLQEKKWWMFRLTVDKLGREAVDKFLDRVWAIEGSGGEMTADGGRRRTPGGVFWRVVKEEAADVYRQVMESDKEQQKLNRKRQVEMRKEEAIANKRQRMEVEQEAEESLLS